MNEDALTLATCSYNTPDVTMTMLRSYVHHNGPGPHPLILVENSTDESTRRLLEKEDVPYVTNPRGRHSPSVDVAIGASFTDVLLLVDTDIVFHRSVAGPRDAFSRWGLTLMGEVCGDRGGHRLHRRVHPWFCFIHAGRIRERGIRFHDEARIRASGSDGFYGNVPLAERDGTDRKLYDVGATFYEDVDRAGLRIGHAEMERDFFTHFEGSSWHAATGQRAFRELAARTRATHAHEMERYRNVRIAGCFVPGFREEVVATRASGVHDVA